MTDLRRLEQNLKRADTVNYREQQRGMNDLSVRQTRRMYFAATALSRAAGALAREQRSRRIAAVRADDDDLEAALIQQERDKAGDETEQCPQCGGPRVPAPRRAGRAGLAPLPGLRVGRGDRPPRTGGPLTWRTLADSSPTGLPSACRPTPRPASGAVAS